MTGFWIAGLLFVVVGFLLLAWLGRIVSPLLESLGIMIPFLVITSWRITSRRKVPEHGHETEMAPTAALLMQ